MLDLARRRQPSPRAWFHHNTTDDLGLFEDESFDFIYTRLVLQHIPPEHALRYVDEFIRVLRPGGVAVFQAPGEVRWLDDSAFQAEIDLPGGDAAFGRLAPGRPYVRAVRVLNAGKVAWPKNTISLGNHWLGENGDLVQIDDGRTPVLRDLGPQQQAGLQLTVTSPPTVGRYVLEFDMVQECVTWFAHRGSRTLRIPVVVREPAAVRITNRAVRALTAARMWPTSRAAVVPATPETSYEVHVIPIGAVLKVIEAGGVDLVEVADDDSCGGGLVSCRYTISKARSPDRAWPETPSVHET
jgi:SAM-dependent methyltransferase